MLFSSAKMYFSVLKQLLPKAVHEFESLHTLSILTIFKTLFSLLEFTTTAALYYVSMLELLTAYLPATLYCITETDTAPSATVG